MLLQLCAKRASTFRTIVFLLPLIKPFFFLNPPGSNSADSLSFSLRGGGWPGPQILPRQAQTTGCPKRLSSSCLLLQQRKPLYSVASLQRWLGTRRRLSIFQGAAVFDLFLVGACDHTEYSYGQRTSQPGFSSFSRVLSGFPFHTEYPELRRCLLVLGFSCYASGCNLNSKDGVGWVPLGLTVDLENPNFPTRSTLNSKGQSHCLLLAEWKGRTGRGGPLLLYLS